jgi:hypothetical protein
MSCDQSCNCGPVIFNCEQTSQDSVNLFLKKAVYSNMYQEFRGATCNNGVQYTEKLNNLCHSYIKTKLEKEETIQLESGSFNPSLHPLLLVCLLVFIFWKIL